MSSRTETGGRSKRGFTLVELITVISIMSVIALVTSYVIMGSMRVYGRMQPKLDASYHARLASGRMLAEIRDLSDTSKVTSMTSTAFTFEDSGGSSIAYSLSGADLLRNGDKLAQNVSSLVFSYWKSDGTAASAAADLHIVEIDLTITVASEAYRVQTAAFPMSLTPGSGGGGGGSPPSGLLDESASAATSARKSSKKATLDLVSISATDLEIASLALSADQSTEKVKKLKLDNNEVWKENSGVELPLEDTSLNSGSSSDRTIPDGESPELELEFKSSPSGTIEYTLVLTYTTSETSTITFTIPW